MVGFVQGHKQGHSVWIGVRGIMSPFRVAAPRPPEPKVPFDWSRVTRIIAMIFMPFIRVLKILLFPLFFISYHGMGILWVHALNFAVGYVFFGDVDHFMARTGRSKNMRYLTGYPNFTWSEEAEVANEYHVKETLVFELRPRYPKVNWWDLFEPKKEEKK
jgi:hypothetical protein